VPTCQPSPKQKCEPFELTNQEVEYDDAQLKMLAEFLLEARSNNARQLEQTSS
jgi:hypothetical protein